MKFAIGCGIDRLDQDRALSYNLSYGLLTNSASINKLGITVLESLYKNEIHIDLLFSPEHGFYAKWLDGVPQKHDLHKTYNVPIISLYDQDLKPSDQQLKNLDGIIIDLPNIGIRYYTYLWTMALMLEA